MLSDYRQRFCTYHSELNHEDYLYRSGYKGNRESAEIIREYSDLFSISVLKELRGILNDVADYRETERASIKRLIAFAVAGNLAARVREVTNEIEASAAAARIEWDGRKIGFHESAELLANESDRSR